MQPLPSIFGDSGLNHVAANPGATRSATRKRGKTMDEKDLILRGTIEGVGTTERSGFRSVSRRLETRGVKLQQKRLNF
jgi:hypothetical protein